MPIALTAGLAQIDEVAAEGDLQAPHPSDIDLETDSVGEPIRLPDGKLIYPPRLHGAPVHELACQLLDMQSPERSRFLRLVGPPGTGKSQLARGMPRCPTQVSGRGHCMAGRRASLGHLDLATHPGAGMLDRLTRSWVLGLSGLEQVKDVLRAQCRPKREELVI
jgi:hypothetical protein